MIALGRDPEPINDAFFRLLCVEDNPMLRQTLKVGLGIYGFEVIAASHGIDALMQFRANEGRFGAILTDHDMPEMNGLQFVHEVRKMGYVGRIIVMSGRLSTDEFRQYQPHTVSGFFHKPFEIGLLAAMLFRDES